MSIKDGIKCFMADIYTVIDGISFNFHPKPLVNELNIQSFSDFK